MRNTYVEIKHFKVFPPAAVFKHAYPCFDVIKDSCGHTRWVTQTHFCLNLDSVHTRIGNLKLPKNGAPHDLTQEYIALRKLTIAHQKLGLPT